MLQCLIHQLLRFFYPLVKKLLPYQVYAYLAVGAANTLLNIGLFMIVYFWLSHAIFAVEMATAASFLVTVVSGFWLNKNIAFTNADSGKKDTQKQFGKYFLVSLQGQCSDYLITKALIVLLTFNPGWAYIVSTGIMLVINYFLQKYFTFRNKKLRL
jgi:putative flippase GtrA